MPNERDDNIHGKVAEEYRTNYALFCCFAECSFSVQFGVLNVAHALHLCLDFGLIQLTPMLDATTCT